MNITPERDARFKQVAARRQENLTVILENVHDPHNIGAVMRSCDAVGIGELFVVYTEERLIKRGLVGSSSSSGTKKWVKVRYFESLDECMSAVKKKYKSIYATHLGEQSINLHSMDLTQSTALLFGNEHDGVSKEALTHCDGNFVIPQFGMVQSLNISVACAVSLYEALRQRDVAQLYNNAFDENNPMHKNLYDDYVSMQIRRNGPR